MRKGLGKQILRGLIQYCREEFDAKEFIYSTREENRAPNLLAELFGFTRIFSAPKIDSRDGHKYNVLQYRCYIE
ncbi:MAG: hypothetical protein HFE83_08485 [Lachnospiraceae bacterium]|nr:hypothetical protein [Lachnospiraceae bacterium]